MADANSSTKPVYRVLHRKLLTNEPFPAVEPLLNGIADEFPDYIIVSVVPSMSITAGFPHDAFMIVLRLKDGERDGE